MSHRQGIYDFKEIPPALEFLSSPKFIAELEPFYEDKNFQISLQLEPKDDHEVPSPSKQKTLSTSKAMPAVDFLDIVDDHPGNSHLPEAMRPNYAPDCSDNSDDSSDDDDPNVRTE